MPISGLLAVFHTWKEGADDRLMVPLELDPEKQSHVALWELVSWHWRTGLIKLLGLDRAVVISLGDRRECTGRRAEAIMSVLGVTQWYKNALATKDPMLSLEELERDLVLDKYPLDFVNELAATIPGDMFSALQKLNIDTTLGGSVQDMAQEGTMLPFSRTHAYYEDADNFRIGGFPSVTHVSVAKWRVQRDGSVLMPQACVVSGPATASNPSAAERVLPAQLKGFFPSDIGHAPLPPGKTSSSLGIDFTERGYINLHRWIQQRTTDTYAVLTRYSFTSLSNEEPSLRVLQGTGLILEKCGGHDTFVKKFHFGFHDEWSTIDISESEEIDWKVL
jgi:hypothetical protein